MEATLRRLLLLHGMAPERRGADDLRADQLVAAYARLLAQHLRVPVVAAAFRGENGALAPSPCSLVVDGGALCADPLDTSDPWARRRLVLNVACPVTVRIAGIACGPDDWAAEVALSMGETMLATASWPSEGVDVPANVRWTQNLTRDSRLAFIRPAPQDCEWAKEEPPEQPPGAGPELTGLQTLTVAPERCVVDLDARDDAAPGGGTSGGTTGGGTSGGTAGGGTSGDGKGGGGGGCCIVQPLSAPQEGRVPPVPIAQWLVQDPPAPGLPTVTFKVIDVVGFAEIAGVSRPCRACGRTWRRMA
jgi:uncharacterized membrane protein YgcG